jgi:hypothetical protein
MVITVVNTAMQNSILVWFTATGAGRVGKVFSSVFLLYIEILKGP